MNQNQNIYNQQQMPPNQPQMGQPLMPPPMPPHQMRPTWQQRIMSNPNQRSMTLQQDRTIPNWLVGKSVIFFVVSMLACWAAFGYVPEVDLWFVSVLSVVLFFYGCRSLSFTWALTKEKFFLRNIFITGFLIRLLWIVYCYFFFNFDHYGYIYGDAADTGWYMDFALDIAQWIRGDSTLSLSQIIDYNGSAIDDVGYPFWLAIVNVLTFGVSDVFVPFVIKCIMGAYCAICIYNVSKRHFGIGSARMAALFICFNPNIIYWCGTMFKEVEMVFLCCLCVDLVDRTFTSGRKLNFKGLLPGVLVGLSLFFFRAALGMVLFLAMFAHIVMASGKVMSAGKKIIAGVMVAIVLFLGMGDRLRTQTESIVETVQSDKQEVNMNWRAEREGGNEFAKYAGKTVFAPLIFTIPFPTFNQANEGQILQTQLSGGNYIKNIFSFFVLLVMFIMLISGEWRRHVFILAYTLGYLMSLVLSNFAHSSRFHMPIWPMLMLFAAFGIQLSKSNPKYRRWFTIALCVEVIACLAWNWFKLKGRGMI